MAIGNKAQKRELIGFYSSLVCEVFFKKVFYFTVPVHPFSVLQLPHLTGTDKAGPVEGAKSKLFHLELLRTNFNTKPPYHQYSINCPIVFHCLILRPPSTPPPCQP